MPSWKKLALATTFTACGYAQNHYRISPIDGSKIAIPSASQLAFQAKEFGMLIHYDLATFINHPDGCNTDTHLVPSLSVFDPSKLNVTQWVDTIQSVGANYATLVIKHNCGFALYPSKQSFTNRDGIVEPYNYTIAYTDNDSTRDVAGEFASGMSSRGLGHGYYFSVNFNNYLNVANNQVYNDTTAGQQPINQTEYNRLTYAMLTEVWSNYGDLTEIWLDGGFRSDQQDAIAKLIKQYQPKANVFNGCSQEDGYCVSRNSVRWVGTETGVAPTDNWSTGYAYGGGDPTSPYYAPAVADTTLQNSDHWFWASDVGGIRSLSELVSVYRTSVGRNANLELDLTPDDTGLIPAAYVSRYTELGNWIQNCYGTPVGKGTVIKSPKGVYHVMYSDAGGVSFNNVVIREDQTHGQVIRSYGVYVKTTSKPKVWTLVSSGKSVGNKRIDYGFGDLRITELKVNTTYVDTPVWKGVTIHSCREPTS